VSQRAIYDAREIPALGIWRVNLEEPVFALFGADVIAGTDHAASVSSVASDGIRGCSRAAAESKPVQARPAGSESEPVSGRESSVADLYTSAQYHVRDGGIATSRTSSASGLRVAGVLSLAAGLLMTLTGCQDSFMDPSVLGRWEHTPTVVPVLDRIATIEDEDAQLVERSDPMPEDLLPQAFIYQLTPGDSLDVTLYDLIVSDKPDTYRVTIDAKGAIDLPQLGRVQVAGKSVDDAVAAIQSAMTRLVSNPLAQITVLDARGASYSITGNVDRAGSYSIPNANYHLLEALSAGGRVEENVEDIFVIRRISLDTSASAAESTTPATKPAEAAPTKQPSGDDLLKVIDDVTGPGTKKSSSPGMMNAEPPAAPAAKPPAPVVDLPDAEPAKTKPASKEAPANANASASQWIFVNGTWTQTNPAARKTADGKAASQSAPSVTQRVIRIPLRKLVAGTQDCNIVVRPGDVIVVPAPPSGLVYMSGQVARPGPISLPPMGGLTLLRALDAAGGLGNIAIPERIDLTRMIGRDRQATIRLDGRAIAEQTQPDVYLKANDRINVGTNFWALPLAVIRNGFRANYGFGFIVDRNFGNDIFGPPPEAVRAN